MGYEALAYDVILLTDEERMIRDVGDSLDESVIPKIENACREGVFLDEWRQRLAA